MKIIEITKMVEYEHALILKKMEKNQRKPMVVCKQFVGKEWMGKWIGRGTLMGIIYFEVETL